MQVEHYSIRNLADMNQSMRIVEDHEMMLTLVNQRCCKDPHIRMDQQNLRLHFKHIAQVGRIWVTVVVALHLTLVEAVEILLDA